MSGVSRAQCTVPQHAVPSSLRTDVLRSLHARGERVCISVLARRGAATSCSGLELLAQAQLRLRRWQTHLGEGPLTLIVALPPGAEFLFTLIAALLGEHTLVPVAPPRAGDEPDRLQHIARNCWAVAVLGRASQRARIDAQLRGGDGQAPCPMLAVDDETQPVAVSSPRPSRHAGIPIIQHTSGSTRLPKAVPIHAAQIRANCTLIQSLWGMDADTVMLNWLPHFHDMGLMGGILYPLLSGAHSLQMDPLEVVRSPLAWLQAISTHRATFSGGPAFAFQQCLDRIADDDAAGLDLSCWQRAYCGAEPVPAGLLDAFGERFARHGLARRAVFACYGLAEYTLFAAGEPATADDDARRDPTAVTEPCVLSAQTRDRLRIADPRSGAAVPEGTTGEIWLRGASAGRGYLGAPQDSARSFHRDPGGESWLRTGDLGRVQDRHLYISGRDKDVIIVHGRNVSAAEIEWCAAREEARLNPLAAAAFARPDAAGGHADLYIEVLPGRSMPDDPETLIDRIRRAVAGSLGVDLDDVRILPRGTLPRTSSGKIRRRAVALGSPSHRAPAPPQTP